MTLLIESPESPDSPDSPEFSDSRESNEPVTFFRRTPSLGPLIEFWRGVHQQPHHPLHPCAERIVREVHNHPELSGPLTPELKVEHAELIAAMLPAIFAQGLQRFAFSAVATPGTFEIHYATPRFRRELLDENGKVRGRLNSGGLNWEQLGSIFSCLAIARQFYQLDIEFTTSVIYEVETGEHGLKRYYQMRAHLEHSQLRGPDKLDPLTPEQVRRLRKNLKDLNVWKEVIPFEQFEMFGLTVFDATDVTEEIVTSQLHQQLIAKDCLPERDSLLRVQNHLRELLGIHDLQMAIPAYADKQVFVFTPNMENDSRHNVSWLENACVLTPDEDSEEYEGACGLVVYDDLQSEQRLSPCAVDVKEEGMRSYINIPLYLEEEEVGSLMCFSPRAGLFNELTHTRLRFILPQMAWAVQRTLESFESRVQSVMKERFTALHPSVEWRFRLDAVAQVKGEATDDDILFADLYPLFGTSDVRNSTVLRNSAIVADLSSQLCLAEKVLIQAQQVRPLAYLDSLRYRIVQWKETLSKGLNTGDESRTVEFLKQELEPLFSSLTQVGFGVGEAVRTYYEALEPRLGLVYHERKRYEKSMSLVRETVADILTAGQERAQADFPHYFELHKTDGVDHTIYIGSSLVENRPFDPLFLRNLRLWQLQSMVEVVRRTGELTSQMELKLGTAHLILVQDSPITIRFSLEEKQFNVDGTYNARYEILKKRIDKAEVRETGERLTQPGKLAIVYSHPREAAEYQRYLRYLASQGQVAEKVEEFEVAPLQGVQGLRALRVEVLDRVS